MTIPAVKEPKTSIFCPRPEPTCLQSLLAQTDQDFALALPESEQIPSDFSCLRKEPQATGRYLFHVQAGCIYSPHTLAVMTRAMELDGTALCICGACFSAADSRALLSRCAFSPKDKLSVLQRLIAKGLFSLGNTMLRNIGGTCNAADFPAAVVCAFEKEGVTVLENPFVSGTLAPIEADFCEKLLFQLLSAD